MEKKQKGILFPYLWKYKFSYILGLLTLLLVDYMSLYIPQLTGDITDGLSTGTLDIKGAGRLCLYILLCAAIIAAGRFLYRYFIFGSARKIELEIRNSMFAKLETLSQRFYNENKTGDLMTHFINDLQATRMAIGPAIISMFDAIVMTAMVLYTMMFEVDLKLTLMTLFPMLIIAVGGYFFGEAFDKRFGEKQAAFAKMSDQVQESISGERVIKAFTQEKLQSKVFAEINDNNRNKNLRVVKLMATAFPFLEFVVGTTYIITLVYGGYLTLYGEITLGQFIAFNQYIGMLVWPMIAFGDMITSVAQARAAIGRIRHIYDEVPDIQDAEDCVAVSEIKGDIRFEDVSFAYTKDGQTVLEDISIHVKPGETLAILGRTGAGKTTFVNLVTRMYDTTNGTIYIDGHDIRKIPLMALRENIAYVPQDNFMFSDTLVNNIKFGNLDASMDEVIEACEVACIHDNIMDFPEKYETMVGERGVTLSGGQKQRSSIARALLKKSPILIMDDSLSAVDTDTEAQILENLHKLNGQQTKLMIAHRVSTVQHADHILVLDEGKIVEYGTHDELMAKNGIFRSMYDKQQLEKELAKV
ncbi:MAG: ABC transporter ATP-binding protein [Erysipelotrichaceae bacterium]|nr:ABC transporter ATP-binding protein [Erysipelotrichaceae bacterium]